MYTTLATVISELKGSEVYKGAGTDQQILRYIRTVNGRIKDFGYNFEPQYQIKKITPSGANIDSQEATLALDAPLLECFSITVGGTAYAYGSTIVPDPDDGQSPVNILRIAAPITGPLHSWLPTCLNVEQRFGSVVITGLWGMRRDYSSQGFFDSSNTCPALTASQASFAVQDIGAEDPYGRTPMFSPGNLIRVDNELMDVVKAEAGDSEDTLTVFRGACNTPRVEHSAGTTIQVWAPEWEIMNMATRQACLLYARRGSYQETQVFPDGLAIKYPSDLLAEIRATIQQIVGA